VADDVLDYTADAATLGKTPGKDARLERPTLVRALGLEGARLRSEEQAEAVRLRARALSFGPGSPLHDLAAHVLARRT